MSLMVHEGQTRGTSGRVSDSRPNRDVPIDWSHLSRFTLNDRELEHEVLGLFAMEAPRYLAKMYAAMTHKEWIEAAHTLKGSARAVGAWAIAECAQSAETLQLTTQIERSLQPGTELINLAGNRGLTQALDKLSEAVEGTLAYINELRLVPVTPVSHSA